MLPRSPMPSAGPFLHLPTELRLSIYELVLREPRNVTVGTALLTGAHADIVYHLYGQGRVPTSGIPLNHEAVVEPGYNASLLSVTHPATIPVKPCAPNTSPSITIKGRNSCEWNNHSIVRRKHAYNGTNVPALLLVNKKIHREVLAHFPGIKSSRATSLFVQYPHGLHVCKTMTPKLLDQAKSVHIAGSYTPHEFLPERAARLPLTGQQQKQGDTGTGTRHTALQEEHHKIGCNNGGIRPDSAAELGQIVQAMFEPLSPTSSPSSTATAQRVSKLEMRIYYPGSHSYSTVWGDDDSPIAIALRNTGVAEIAIEVWRGRHGTGVYLCSNPAKDTSQRSVSTVWRHLEEGGKGQPECGSWVLDPLWPTWSEDLKMSEKEAVEREEWHTDWQGRRRRYWTRSVRETPGAPLP